VADLFCEPHETKKHIEIPPYYIDSLVQRITKNFVSPGRKQPKMWSLGRKLFFSFSVESWDFFGNPNTKSQPKIRGQIQNFFLQGLTAKKCRQYVRTKISKKSQNLPKKPSLLSPRPPGLRGHGGRIKNRVIMGGTKIGPR
jgi:hypothetical protein